MLGVSVDPAATVAVFALIVLNALLWRAYLASARAQGIGPLARQVLAQHDFSLHFIGHAVPAALIALASLAPDAARVLLAIAGVAAMFGGAYWKFAVIVRAGFTQGFKLSHMPQRGSGKRAAPSRMDASGMPKPATVR